MRTHKRFLVALLAPMLAGALAAQTQSKQAVMMAMSANGKRMAAYQWKQRVTVIRRGTPLEPTIEELRFDAAGQLQRTTLSKPAEKRMGPLRAHKVGEVKEDILEVMQLARRYTSPQQLGAILQQGEMWEGPGTLRIQARARLLPIDDVVITVSRATCLATRMDVKTQHEGSPVAITVDYLQLPNGPSMMSRMTVQIPANDIVVNVESYDLVRLAIP